MMSRETVARASRSPQDYTYVTGDKFVTSPDQSHGCCSTRTYLTTAIFVWPPMATKSSVKIKKRFPKYFLKISILITLVPLDVVLEEPFKLFRAKV